MKTEYILESLNFSSNNIEYTWVWIALGILAVGITYLITRFKANRRIKEFKTLKKAISSSNDQLNNLQQEISESQDSLNAINEETKELQKLKKNAGLLEVEINDKTTFLDNLKSELAEETKKKDETSRELHQLLAKLDLYSRIDEFTEVGLFEIPEYLFETSARFGEEIKAVREKQRDLIKLKEAITYPEDIVVHPDKSQNNRVLQGQVKLMLTAFNIECDNLIGKVKPSSYARTLERIEKLANNIERSASSLRCGFKIDYIKLKYEECRLQYQHTLKKQDEQEEQRLIEFKQ